MNLSIVNYVILVTAVFSGIALSYFNFNSRVILKIGFIWIALITAGIFTHMVVVIAICVGLAISIRNEPEESKLIYFTALLPALPVEGFLIPFPGVNYIWSLSYPKLLILCLLFPLFFSYISKLFRQGAVFKISDLLFITFFLVTVYDGVRRGGTATALVRSIFDDLILFVVIYFAISQYLRSPHVLNWILSMFVFTASVVAFMSIFESLLGWRMYVSILNKLSLQYDILVTIPYARGGIARAAGGAMLNPLAYGFFAPIAIVIIYFMLQKKQLKLIFAAPLLITIFTSMMFTGSRGGLLMTMIGIAVLYYAKLNKFLRKIILISAAVLTVPLITFIFNADLSFIDKEGTFKYRVDLIKNSLNVVYKNPLLGSSDFRSDPALEGSRQGQGIIDIVNTYLGIVLSRGLVGLFSFVGLFVVLIRGITSKKNARESSQSDLLLAILVMIMVFIFTCSTVSFIHFYLIFFLALASAYTKFPRDQEPAFTSMKTAPN